MTKNEWDDYAAGWDSDPGARAYAEAAFASLGAVLESTGASLNGARVLDFGCGTGLLTEHLVAGGASVHAVDTSQSMLDVLRSKPALGDVVSGPELPRPSEGFDLIVCSSVCSFLDDYPGTARDLVSRLERGGLFVQWDWEKTDVDDEHGLTRAEIQAALNGSGLVDVEVGRGFEIEVGVEAEGEADAGVEGAVMAPLMGYGRRPG